MYETKIQDIDDLRKLNLTLNKTLSMLRLTNGMAVWDHVCVPVVDTLNTCY